MKKSRSLAILMLGLACLFMIACLTRGTPKQSGGTPTKSQATAGRQAPPAADSAGQKRTARHSGDVRSVTSARLKNLTVKAVQWLGNPSSSRAVRGQSIETMRAIIYVALGQPLQRVSGDIVD
jgi:hypothetical protein